MYTPVNLYLPYLCLYNMHMPHVRVHIHTLLVAINCTRFGQPSLSVARHQNCTSPCEIENPHIVILTYYVLRVYSHSKNQNESNHSSLENLCLQNHDHKIRKNPTSIGWRCSLQSTWGVSVNPRHKVVKFLVPVTWSPTNPCFDWSLGLVLGGWPSKLRLKFRVPGIRWKKQTGDYDNAKVENSHKCCSTYDSEKQLRDWSNHLLEVTFHTGTNHL